MTDPQISIRDTPSENRFEVWVGDALAGFAEYRLHASAILFTHTEIDPAFEHRGLGKQLVRTALEDASDRGLSVYPFCPLVAHVIRTQPGDYLRLVPQEARAKFDLPRTEEAAAEETGR